QDHVGHLAGIAGLKRFRHLMKLLLGVGASPSCRLATSRAKVRADRVPRDRSKPGSETVARPITAETTDVLGDRREDLLDEIRGIISRRAGLPAPPIDRRAVQGYQPSPGL